MRHAQSRMTDWWPVFVIILGAVVIVCFVIVLLIGYGLNGRYGPADDRFGLADSDLAARVITDSKTGVYYLVIDGTGVTPLLSADGLPLMVDDANHGDVDVAIEAARVNMGVTG